MKKLLFVLFIGCGFALQAQDSTCNCIEFEILEVDTKRVLDLSNAPALTSSIDENTVHLFFEVGGGYGEGQYHFFSFQNELKFTLAEEPLGEYGASGLLNKTRIIPKVQLPAQNQKVQITFYDPDTGWCKGTVLAYVKVDGSLFKYSGTFDVVLLR